ncbi:kalirin-like [Gryllus bimaculatus]|nr:kalirin-like [Gryllus bimaculatus]
MQYSNHRQRIYNGCKNGQLGHYGSQLKTSDYALRLGDEFCSVWDLPATKRVNPCYKRKKRGRFRQPLNTYTNAEKLLTAAEELAQTGECNADEIYQVAHELESHVTSFAARVEQRRRRLDLAVLFYTHDKEGSFKEHTPGWSAFDEKDVVR